jgi:hypothetical protein
MEARILTIGGDQIEACVRDIAECQPEEMPGKLTMWRTWAARAAHELAVVEAEYRIWRANLQQNILGVESKLAEWKLKGQIDSDPLFLKWKRGQAMAAQNVAIATAMADGYEAAIQLFNLA